MKKKNTYQQHKESFENLPFVPEVSTFEQPVLELPLPEYVYENSKPAVQTEQESERGVWTIDI